MKEIIILGSGGHSRSVVDAIEKEGKFKIVGFLDEQKKKDYIYQKYKVLGDDSILDELYRNGITQAFLGMASIPDTSTRRKLFVRLKKTGFTIPSITDPSAVLAKDVVIGEGSYIGKSVIINSGTKVGKMCILNTGVIAEHDCQIGDFTHLSVGSILCGGVKIGKDSFIGAGTTIIQDIFIDNQSVLGAGSLILGNVKSGTNAHGIIKEEYSA